MPKPACLGTSVLAPRVVAVIELSAYIQQIPVTTSGRFHCTITKQIMCNVQPHSSQREEGSGQVSADELSPRTTIIEHSG